LLFSILIHTFASTLKSRFTYIIVVTIIYFMFFIPPDNLLGLNSEDSTYSSLFERLKIYFYLLQFIFNPTNWLKLIWFNNFCKSDLLVRVLNEYEERSIRKLPPFVDPVTHEAIDLYKSFLGFSCENNVIYSIFGIITLTYCVVIYIIFMLAVSPSIRLKLKK
ncbi:hypothetical protein NGRA_3430, partial [Nosema granulosis]